MNILIVDHSQIPPLNYGGTERVIWFLGKELASLGHKITYLVYKGSHCDFAEVLFIDKAKPLSEQIPEKIDIIHFNSPPQEPVPMPYVVTIHGNLAGLGELDSNSIFISRDHAQRYGSSSFVYNGIDWGLYPKPKLANTRNYFHFLGNAAWRVKNVKGAIQVISATKDQTLKVLGGSRLNFKMGFRFTLSRRVEFEGMVAGDKKINLLQGSKGLVFPVRWHEPFGLAIIESLFMGCPVFGTPYGSLPELINAEVGYLSNSHIALAEQIENSQQFDKNKCHQYALDLFSSKKMALEYLDKYEQVLNGKRLNATKPQLQQQAPKFLEWN